MATTDYDLICNSACSIRYWLYRHVPNAFWKP